MRPYTAYAILETTRTGKQEIAIFDARLPIYWKRNIANSVNLARCNGTAEIVQVTIRKRGKPRTATKVRKRSER